MEKQEFIKNFANQFDETELTEFQMETSYRDLEEWSSLVALAVLNMLGKKYEVKITAEELKTTSTLQDLYELVLSKK